MKYRHYVLCFLLLICSGAAYGQQTKKKRSKSKQQTSRQLIKRAMSIQEKAPTEAIKLIEEAISYARQRKDLRTEGEAYVLLGNIYEDINQEDLALQRYQQALPLIRPDKINPDAKAFLHEKIGRIYLNQKDIKAAELNFKTCIEESYGKSLTLRCEEGLADVKLLRMDANASVEQLNSIESNYTLDSISIALNEVRRAQVYVQQENYDKANEAYNNSFNSLPNSKKISKEDFKTFQKTKEDLLNIQTNTTQEKVDIRSNIASNSNLNFSIDAQVTENLKIAELYEAENDLVEAEKFIVVSKNLITPSTDAAVAADVYKKSSEINQRQGKVNAALDDLELYISAKEKSINKLETDLKEQVEIVKGQQQIDLNLKNYDLDEKEDELIQSQLETQKIIIGLLSLVLIGSLVFFYFLYKNVKEKRKANQKLFLKSLRTQMNPHFIFNALNSVNNFIAKNDEKAANKFLSDFSRLMRKVLDYSQKDFIAFEEEMELNELYLKLEHFRFRDKFDYKFENNAQQHGYSMEVPPMLIQPFIENAVWHGLRYKEGKGNLEVSINEENNFLTILIKDDGIGRKKSKALKTSNQKKYKSTGLDNVTKRIALINDLYKKNYDIKVSDADENSEDTGTLVEIRIPVE